MSDVQLITSLRLYDKDQIIIIYQIFTAIMLIYDVLLGLMFTYFLTYSDSKDKNTIPDKGFSIYCILSRNDEYRSWITQQLTQNHGLLTNNK